MIKKIPTGISDFQRLRRKNYYTVDKTMMISEFLERGTAATLITRPRRFGKTLNMSMMAEFFDITKDSRDLFEGLAIMDTEYVEEMNQWPVIFITFADCKGNYEATKSILIELLRKEYAKYKHIFDKNDLEEDLLSRVRETYTLLCEGNNLNKLTTALRTLCEFLSQVYNKNVMIFLDEYDTPFIEAHVNNFYEELHDVLAGIVRTSLKNNNYYEYAMITGIQRVAKENIFSDLNNLEICSVKDNEYSNYFGFTTTETKDLLEFYGLELNENVKKMYDGYVYGGQEIYNPWSIVNYTKRKVLEPYWVNTGSNKMIKKALKQVGVSFRQEFQTLVETGSITTIVNMNTSFYEDADNSSLWGLFVNAGYLTIEKVVDLEEQMYTLRMPNRELLGEFKSFSAFYLNVNVKVLNDLYHSLLGKDSKKFLEAYRTIQLSNPSYNDLISENSYHMLLLGICLYIQNDYEVLSNRESGEGRSDLILKAKRVNLPSYVIELKYANNETFDKNSAILKDLAKEAIEQIVEKRYDVVLTGEIIHVGLAHHAKVVEMMWIQK